jgi:hypothetical protein
MAKDLWPLFLVECLFLSLAIASERLCRVRVAVIRLCRVVNTFLAAPADPNSSTAPEIDLIAAKVTFARF